MPASVEGRPGMRLVLSCLLVAGAALLAGCASGQWRRDGASEQDVVRDEYACEREVAAMYPPAIVRGEAYGSTQETTDCKRKGDRVQCRTTTTPPMSFGTDANEGRRDQAHESCMRSRGYRWQEDR